MKKIIANSLELTQRRSVLSVEFRHQGDWHLGRLLEVGPTLHFGPPVTLPCLTQIDFETIIPAACSFKSTYILLLCSAFSKNILVPSRGMLQHF